MKRAILGLGLLLASAAAATADELVQQFTGSGQHTTRPFTVDGPWEAQWNSRGGVFMIYLYRDDGSLVTVLASHVDGGKGSAYQPKAGIYYLQMLAIGRWTVRIVKVD